MSTVIDYAGRTVDMLAFQGAILGRDVLLTQTLAGSDGGEVCTGVQKLAQRWLIEFLTATGSIYFLPARGCMFIPLIMRGQLRTTLDAQQAFYLSAKQVQANLQAEEDPTTPEDEAFGSVTLDSMSASNGTISLSVTIASAAGTTAQIILPISVAPVSAVH